MNSSPLRSNRSLAIFEKKPLAGSSVRKPDKNETTVTATIIVRRRQGIAPETEEDLQKFQIPSERKVLTIEEHKKRYGSLREEMAAVVKYVREHGLKVIDADEHRRSALISGTIEQMETIFGIKIIFYHHAGGNYRSYEGSIQVPVSLFGIIETVIGIDNRPLPVKRFAQDPVNTVSLTPQQVAGLYHFPPGNGGGQTIGILEIANPLSTPGYTAGDLAQTMNNFGGLAVPVPIDVSIDGQTNSGIADLETTVDITVAGAVAQGASIAVYFTGSSIDNLIHALQAMILPQAGQPRPSVISISYGFTPDDTTEYVSDDEFKQISELFVDAKGLQVTVVCASGDTGTRYLDAQQPQTVYPASDPYVLACGGTTIGNINPNNGSFDEWVWNDTYQGNTGVTGGGISERFGVPTYQLGQPLPTRINTGIPGRGVPDVAGNASNNSGYPVAATGYAAGYIPGGTSVVAPLYAGLIAIINSILTAAGFTYRAGFINPVLYWNAKTVCRDVDGSAGPSTNGYAPTPGYNARAGWDACTGLGSIRGWELLNAMRDFSATIRLHSKGQCDVVTIAGNTIVLSAQITDALGPVQYNWVPTNAAFAPGSLATDPTAKIIVPATGTAFSVDLTVTDPYGQAIAHRLNLKSFDAGIAGITHELCEFLIWSRQFKQPIYINPGDGPYSPFQLQQLQVLEQITAKLLSLTGRILRGEKEPGNANR